MKAQSTIPTTTVSGCLKVDSSVVTTGSVSVGGILTVDSALTVNDDVKAENLDISGNLNVIGDAAFTGKIIANKGIAFDNTGSNIISYTNTGTSNIYSYGKILPVLPTCITPNTGNSNPLHNFFGMMSSRANNGLVNSALNVGSAPWDGNGVIEVEGSDQNGADNNILMINYFCGRNTAINTNNGLPNEGGIVYMGKRVAMQNSLRIGYDGNNPIDVTSNLSLHTSNGTAIKCVTWDNSAKILTIQNGNFGTKSPFTVMGDGKTYIGVERLSGMHTDAWLQVAGKVASKSFYVLKPSNWSDYVFDKNYKAPSLIEEEIHIKENGHLLGVPSEKQVLENGYDINQMDAILLAKLEQAYLHILKLQHEVDELKREFAKKKQSFDNDK